MNLTTTKRAPYHPENFYIGCPVITTKGNKGIVQSIQKKVTPTSEFANYYLISDETETDNDGNQVYVAKMHNDEEPDAVYSLTPGIHVIEDFIYTVAFANKKMDFKAASLRPHNKSYAIVTVVDSDGKEHTFLDCPFNQKTQGLFKSVYIAEPTTKNG